MSMRRRNRPVREAPPTDPGASAHNNCCRGRDLSPPPLSFHKKGAGSAYAANAAQGPAQMEFADLFTRQYALFWVFLVAAALFLFVRNLIWVLLVRRAEKTAKRTKRGGPI